MGTHVTGGSRRHPLRRRSTPNGARCVREDADGDHLSINSQDITLQGMDLRVRAQIHIVNLIAPADELLIVVVHARLDVGHVRLNLPRDLVDELIGDRLGHPQTVQEKG